jgi:predicted secreted protein
MFNFTGFVLFTMIWMLVFFISLPIGIAPESDPDAASGWRGAPKMPLVWRKVMLTTLVSVLLWGGAEYLIASDILSFRHGILAGPNQ